MKKVFAYLRVSTKEQIESDGFDRQFRSICNFAYPKNWEIARTFRDQQSGGSEFENRKALNEMIDLASEGNAFGVTAIVVERADRIARDLIVQELFLTRCCEKKIEVYCADSGEELVLAGADPTRKLIRQILGALAEWDKAQIVLKLQAGRRRKARETGQPCGGPKPYGQTESERAVIAEIRKYRGLGKTFRWIAMKLNETGYSSPDGGEFWSLGTLKNIVDRYEKS